VPRIALAFCLAVGLAGCGGGTTAVTGTVKANGKAVTGGTVVFGPLGGAEGAKAATGEIQSDGTFKLGTNRPGDGAMPGKYRVTFSPPEQQLTEEQRKDPKYIAPPPQYMGLEVKTPEVEIKSGSGSVDLELVPKKAKVGG